MTLALCKKKVAHINIFNKLIFVIVIYSLKNECLIDMTVSYKELKNWTHLQSS